MSEGYDGPAVLVLPGAGPVAVEVRLRGMFQPIDGRFHWWGRLAADERIDAVVESGTDVVVRTPEGEASGRLSDRDPWGRLRVTGTGRPPYDPR